MDAAVAACVTHGAWQITLPGDRVCVSAARRFVRDNLSNCPRADDLAQAATELAANSVAWSAAREKGTFTVTVRTATRWARIEVTDPGPATRPQPDPQPESNGWGLGIVAMVTDQCGTSYGPGPIRTAWAEATWPDVDSAKDGQHAR